MDCTSSMGSWIVRAKETLQAIISNVLDANEGLVIRIGVVGYRDFTDHKLYEVLPFTTVVADARNFIAKLQAIGGGDAPEDLVGGLK